MFEEFHTFKGELSRTILVETINVSVISTFLFVIPRGSTVRRSEISNIAVLNRGGRFGISNIENYYFKIKSRIDLELNLVPQS
jgi:hypothetical protein